MNVCARVVALPTSTSTGSVAESELPSARARRFTHASIPPQVPETITPLVHESPTVPDSDPRVVHRYPSTPPAPVLLSVQVAMCAWNKCRRVVTFPLIG